MNTSKLKQKGQPKKANSLIIEESLTHNSREEPDTNFLQEDQGDWSGNRQCYICNQLVDAETEVEIFFYFILILFLVHSFILPHFQLEFVCHISLCEATLADLAQISNYLDCNSTCEFQSIKLTPQKTLHRRAVSWSGSPSTKLYDEIVFAPETPETVRTLVVLKWIPYNNKKKRSPILFIYLLVCCFFTGKDSIGEKFAL